MLHFRPSLSFAIVRRWVIAGLLTTAACQPQPHSTRQPAAQAYSYSLLPAPGSTFGYEVRQGPRPLIRQLSVPGRPGTTGFARPAQAQATARLVIRKLRAGQVLPTVSVAELDSLLAIN